MSKTNLNRSLLAFLVGGALLPFPACKKDETAEPAPPTPSGSSFTITDLGNNTNKVEGASTASFTFTSNKQWLLQGFVYVESGATLTIEPGTVIKGAEQDFGPEVVVFHAGTKRDADGTLRAAGGRVLNVCARGATLREARDRAYGAIGKIDWPESFHRKDIGWRALGR